MIKMILPTLFLSFCFILSGCITEDTKNETEADQLKIISFSFVTEAYSYNTSWNVFCHELNYSCLPEIVNKSAYYLPHDFSKARYRINGTVKNTAESPIHTIFLHLDFYDNNDTFLFSKQLTNFSVFQPDQTWFFEYTYDYPNPYFKEIESVEINTGIETKEINDIYHKE
jgi:hypothetical protein